MKLVARDIIGLLRIFLGAMAIFLVLAGIHWMAILLGIVLGVIYFALPAK